jgi:hypothetical protein
MVDPNIIEAAHAAVTREMVALAIAARQRRARARCGCACPTCRVSAGVVDFDAEEIDGPMARAC